MPEPCKGWSQGSGVTVLTCTLAGWIYSPLKYILYREYAEWVPVGEGWLLPFPYTSFPLQRKKHLSLPECFRWKIQKLQNEGMRKTVSVAFLRFCICYSKDCVFSSFRRAPFCIHWVEEPKDNGLLQVSVVCLLVCSLYFIENVIISYVLFDFGELLDSLKKSLLQTVTKLAHLCVWEICCWAINSSLVYLKWSQLILFARVGCSLS